jgi:hypothetical protein
MPRFRLRTLLIHVVAAIILAFSALPALAQEKDDPGKGLYGEWVIVEMIHKCSVQDFRGKPGGWFVFEPGGFIRLLDAEQRDEMMRNERIKKRATRPCIIGPREIDIDYGELSGGTPGLTLKALYELKDGKLRIIWCGEYGTRPTDFEALKDAQLTLFVLKKLK